MPAIRATLRELRPDVVIWRAEAMEQMLARQLVQPRSSALLLAGFGMAALLLAAVGVYGIVALAVRQRTRELGVRLALGAAPAQLRTLMLREALVTAGTGVAIGVAGTIAGTRFLRALLFEVSPFDPLALGAACLVLLGTAAIAAYGPARRATGIDPVTALRSE
jgi:ABC-type antimicrobial peptide transport system permease subunit